MDHVAIMHSSWGLLAKIQSGQKTIESRWYLQRRAPWGKIVPGDAVYFKNAGEQVTLRIRVAKVLQFEDLMPHRVQELLTTYGAIDGIESTEYSLYYERFKDKRYCMLIFLQGVEQVPPFQIDKTGFGAQAAWLTVNSINDIKR